MWEVYMAVVPFCLFSRRTQNSNTTQDEFGEILQNVA